MGQTAGVAVVLVGARDVQWVEVVVGFDPALAEVADVAPGRSSRSTAPRSRRSGRSRRVARRWLPAADRVSGSGAVAAITLRGLKPGSGALASSRWRWGTPPARSGRRRPRPRGWW